MCKYSGVLLKKHIEKKRNGRDWEKRKKQNIQQDDKRKERYVCMYVKKSKRKDPFAKTVLY